MNSNNFLSHTNSPATGKFCLHTVYPACPMNKCQDWEGVGGLWGEAGYDLA